MNSPAHNTRSLFVGTGEFSFCSGATTREETKLIGFRDFDNVAVFKHEITNEREEHEGSYRGLKRVDEIFSVKQGLEYTLTCDAFTYENIAMLLMGETGTHHTQTVLAEGAADTLEFTSGTPAAVTQWYDLYVSDAHVRSLTSVVAFVGTPLAATTQDTGDTFTDAAHGLANGDRVLLITLTTTTGASILTPYFVVGATTDTFQLSATAGGSALALTTNGSCTYLAALTEDTDTTEGDYEIDLQLGRIKFAAAQTTTAYVFLTAAAITSADTTYMKGIEPLQQASFEGYGRLVAFHQKSEAPFLDHQDFSCTVVPESIEDTDGKKPTTFKLRVRVTKDVGNLLTADRTFTP